MGVPVGAPLVNVGGDAERYVHGADHVLDQAVGQFRRQVACVQQIGALGLVEAGECGHGGHALRLPQLVEAADAAALGVDVHVLSFRVRVNVRS